MKPSTTYSKEFSISPHQVKKEILEIKREMRLADDSKPLLVSERARIKT